MRSKYPVWACTLALIGAACTSAAPLSSPSPTATSPSATTVPPAVPTGLAAPVTAHLALDRRWYTVPDGLDRSAVQVTVSFDGDPADGDPFVRIEGGREVRLRRGASAWTATVPLDGVAVGERVVAVFERLRGSSSAANVGAATLLLSQPEYVVWTLDFEGDESSDQTMANTAAIADGLKVPMTVMWNPRAWTSAAVSSARADAMLAWTRGRAAQGDEIALHLHMWTDYVRAAGIPPRLSPSWAGRGDGYDVPITAYPKEDQRVLIAYGLKLMSDHGLPEVTSFRAGGDFGDAATLRAVAANRLGADCTAVPAGSFGRLRLPWTLAADAQPYRPSRDDANKEGDLPLLEAPTNAGNTFGHTAASIAPVVRADLAMLARPGEIAAARKGLTIVSHPGTIGDTERAAIEALLRAFEPLRYDRDAGPVRFVTLRQLAQAWR